MAKKRPMLAWPALEAECREILRAKRRPDLDALLALIRAVNPTGHALPPVQEEARYALKSSLQSLLVRHFHEDLTAVPDARDPDVVALNHTHLGADACHATLSSLDEDARTLVEHMLDAPAPVAVSPGHASPRAAWREGNPRDLLRDGDAALDAYDYDSARACYEDALARSDAAPDAARALLTLLVDHLAEDASALEIVATLPPRTQRDVSVRGLAAIAAARTGDVAAARTWIADDHSPRAGDALALLAQSALDRGDATDAARCVADLRARVPSHASLVSLELAVEALRRRARAPAEQRIADALAAARWDDAASLAREVLATWHDSEVARRALATTARHQREREVGVLRGDATAALDAGDVDAAARALARMHELDADDARLIDGLRALRATRRREEAQREADVVVAQWRAGDHEGALAAWVRCVDDARALAHAALQEPVFDWIAALDGGRRHAPPAAMAAVLALRRASDPAMAPQAVVDAITPHERVLSALPAAVEVLARAKEALRSESARRVNAHVAEIERALAAGDLDLARERARLVRAEDASALAPLSEAFAKASRIRALDLEARDVRDDLQRAALLDARLALRDDPGVRVARDEARQRAASAWAVLRFGPVEAGSMLHDLAHDVLTRECAWPLLTEDGVHAWLPQSAWDALCIVRVDIAKGVVDRAWVVQLPMPMRVIEARLDGDVLTVCGEGLAARIDVVRGVMLQWIDLLSLVSPEDTLENFLVLAQGETAWIETRQRYRAADRVVDVMFRQVVREAPPGRLSAVVGCPEVAVMMCDHGVSRFFDASGNASPWPRPQPEPYPVSVTPHPTRNALVGTLCDENDDKTRIRTRIYTPDGRSTAGPDLLDAHAYSPRTVGTSRREGALVVALPIQGSWKVLVLRDVDGALQTAGSFGATHRVSLLTDRDAQHLAAMVSTPDGARVTGMTAWCDARFQGDRPWTFMDGVNSFGECRRREAAADSVRARASLRDATAEGIPLVCDELLRMYGHDPRELLRIADEIRGVEYKRSGQHKRWLLEAARRHPTYVELLNEVAKVCALDADWSAMAEALQVFGARPDASKHVRHALGVAWMWLGRYDEAEALLRSAMCCDDDGCQIENALALATWRRPDPHAPSPNSRLELVLTAVDAALRCLACCDSTGAIRALQRPRLLRHGDRWSLALLAVAHLATTATSDGARFDKVYALGNLLVARHARRYLHPEGSPQIAPKIPRKTACCLTVFSNAVMRLRRRSSRIAGIALYQ